MNLSMSFMIIGYWFYKNWRGEQEIIEVIITLSFLSQTC